MMKKAIDALIEGIQRTGNPVCVGLDTQVSHLPAELGGAAAADAILTYNKRLIDGLADLIPSVKVQIAYYEILGLAGLNAFAETLKYARSAGLTVIADAKRNDIGATAEAYAAAFLGAGDFSADFVTVNPYLGSDGVLPFVAAGKESGGGIFCLVKTSNPSSGELQNLPLEGGKPVYAHMGEMVSAWGKDTVGEHGYSSVGAVVGATYPEEGEKLREALPHTFFLIPGYGAQGGTAKDIALCFDKNGVGGVVNASRSVLAAWKKTPDKDAVAAAREETLRMRDDLMSAIAKKRA